MTAETLAWTVLAVALCGASITGLILAGKWIMRRVDVPAEVAVFADSITADNDAVARTLADNDAAAELDEVIAELAEVLPRVREAS